MLAAVPQAQTLKENLRQWLRAKSRLAGAGACECA